MGLYYNFKVNDPTVAKGINHQILNAEVRFLAQAISRGICSGQNGTGRNITPSTSVFLS
jgi:hypothetical protein